MLLRTQTPTDLDTQRRRPAIDPHWAGQLGHICQNLMRRTLCVHSKDKAPYTLPEEFAARTARTWLESRVFQVKCESQVELLFVQFAQLGYSVFVQGLGG